MDYTFIICPNIIGLLALLILSIFTRFNFYLDKRKLKLFVAAAACNAVIIALEVADYYLGEALFANAYILRRITTAIGFMLTPIIPLLIGYIAEKKPFSKLVLIPAAANMVICALSIFNGCMFYIDEYNSYFRGAMFTELILVSAFYLVLLICVSFRNMRTTRSSEAIFLIGIVAAMLLANMLEIAFSFHFVIWNSCGVLLLAYYLFLHIQYFKFDPLTEVFNRNMYNFDLNNMRRKASVGALSFDLNGLKQINDTKGPEKGDAYIIAAADMIYRCFRGIGNVYRIGGDEFVVLTSGVSKERIEAEIESFKHKCEGAKLSVACGYSYGKGTDDIAQMLRDADNAMYENKRDRAHNR